MSNVRYEDYSVHVKTALKDKALKFLEEVGGEIRSRTQRNSDGYRRTGQTSGSYKYKVDGMAVHIGSDHQNAIWEEFGTGVHAMNGDGRKGYWVYVKGGGTGSKSSTNSKNYSNVEQAKRAVAILRSKGLEAYYTNGRKGRRPLHLAFESSKALIDRVAERVFGEL